MWVTNICGSNAYRRTEERERGVPHPVAAGGRVATRLRAPEAHRVALRRRPHLQRRLALSPALPHGGARLDRRALGREVRRAAQALLPPHARGSHGARGTARELEGVRDGHQPSLRGALCLTTDS